MTQTLIAAMAVCAPEGFHLALAAEVAELGEASSLDALQETCSRSLVEELDRTTRRYRLHTLVREAAGASDLLRRRHAEAICLELGDQNGLQASYGNQALILHDWGRLNDAMELLRKQETICLALGNTRGLAHCYWSWGLLAREQSDSKTEREKLEQALALFTELKMPGEIKDVQCLMDESNRPSNCRFGYVLRKDR